MRQGTPKIAALGRSLAMLEAILADREGRSVAALAQDIGLPAATAHRQVTTLVAERFLARLPGGRLGAGPRLLAMLHMVDDMQMIVAAAAPVLHRLASQVGSIVQLGTLENDMVTYRIKIGRGAKDLFTRTGLQLEAYCSGIGKVLLAYLPEAERRAYLAAGAFVALTPRTITDPALLAEALDRVRVQGFARDEGEIADDLECLAVPICQPDGRVPAAISVSRLTGRGRTPSPDLVLPLLRAAAQEIATTAFGLEHQPTRPLPADKSPSYSMMR
jgi:DNA-binding IclR family transcriptional regulator